jgi:hypothetical protein
MQAAVPDLTLLREAGVYLLRGRQRRVYVWRRRAPGGRDCEVPKQCQVNLLVQAAVPDLTLLREAGVYLIKGRLRESMYGAQVRSRARL